MIEKHLLVATAPQISHETSSTNSIIIFTLSIIKTLAEGNKCFIDPFMMPLVCVL